MSSLYCFCPSWMDGWTESQRTEGSLAKKHKEEFNRKGNEVYAKYRKVFFSKKILLCFALHEMTESQIFNLSWVILSR